MINSYLKTASRNAKKHLFYTSINIVCLAIGLTAGILATMFIFDERSFDSFHTKRDRIFRLNKVYIETDGSGTLMAESSGLMGPTMVTEFPEVEKCTRFNPWYNPVVLTHGDRNVQLESQQLVLVDSTFFSIFDFKLLKGDPNSALAKNGTIVLTPALAQSLFGDDDPVGKLISGPDGIDLEVTGVMDDVPRNSHMQFRALMSWATTDPATGRLPMAYLNNWIAQALCTYVLLRSPEDELSVEAKFPKFMSDHMPTRVDKYKLYLQPFNEVYLHSDNVTALRMQRTGSARFNNFFAVIAAFILFLACVNYININTARGTRRGREVAMRKTLGAKRKQLISQFLAESFVMVMLSAVLAIGLVYLAVPYFNELTGKALAFGAIANPAVIAGITIVILVAAIGSGIYPALVLSAFAPAAIQGTQRLRLTGHLPRQILIVFQFVITIAMITGTIFIYRQIKLVMTADLGFDRENVLVVNMQGNVVDKREVLRNTVEALPNVVSTSTSQSALGMGTFSTYVIPEGFAADQIETRVFLVDGNFDKTYGLSMAEGRFFEPGRSSDSSAVIINEAMLRRLDWTEGTSKTIRFTETEPAVPIIGVVNDFYFNSFYQAIEPVVMVIDSENQVNLAVRFTGNPSNILSTLGDAWKSVEDRYAFRYYFVDEQFAKAYASEEKLLKTVLTFAGMSIIIACLGLYGLVAFTIEQRTREFGIRKVFGATVANLNYLINKKFVALILIGGVLSVPLVIPLVQQWIDKFTLRIDLEPVVFVAAFALTLLITIVAVSVQAIRAGLANPVKALRHS